MNKEDSNSLTKEIAEIDELKVFILKFIYLKRDIKKIEKEMEKEKDPECKELYKDILLYGEKRLNNLKNKIYSLLMKKIN